MAFDYDTLIYGEDEGLAFVEYGMGWLGPYVTASGDMYAVTFNFNGAIVVAAKSTGGKNGGRTWSVPATFQIVNDHAIGIEDIAGVIVGGHVIHVATMASVGSNTYVQYHRFDTNTDSWVETNSVVHYDGNGISALGLQMVDRGNGELVIIHDAYPGRSGNRYFTKIGYHRRVSGVWGSVVELTPSDDTEQHLSSCGAGANSRVHITYGRTDFSPQQSMLTVLRSDNTLLTPIQIGTIEGGPQHGPLRVNGGTVSMAKTKHHQTDDPVYTSIVTWPDVDNVSLGNVAESSTIETVDSQLASDHVVDVNGHAHVCLVSGDSSIKYGVWDGSSWTALETLDSNYVTHGLSLRMFPSLDDGSTRLRAIYRWQQGTLTGSGKERCETRFGEKIVVAPIPPSGIESIIRQPVIAGGTGT